MVINMQINSDVRLWVRIFFYATAAFLIYMVYSCIVYSYKTIRYTNAEEAKSWNCTELHDDGYVYFNYDYIAQTNLVYGNHTFAVAKLSGKDEYVLVQYGDSSITEAFVYGEKMGYTDELDKLLYISDNVGLTTVTPGRCDGVTERLGAFMKPEFAKAFEYINQSVIKSDIIIGENIDVSYAVSRRSRESVYKYFVSCIIGLILGLTAFVFACRLYLKDKRTAEEKEKLIAYKEEEVERILNEHYKKKRGRHY